VGRVDLRWSVLRRISFVARSNAVETGLERAAKEDGEHRDQAITLSNRIKPVPLKFPTQISVDNRRDPPLEELLTHAEEDVVGDPGGVDPAIRDSVRTLDDPTE